MSDGNFADFIARIAPAFSPNARQSSTSSTKLEQKLAAINNEMRAIDAYEAAKCGKAAPRSSGTGTRRASTGRRGSKREGILEAIKNAAGGLTRGELLTVLGLKGDKSGEMSVSNALTALTKGNQVARREGRYHAA